MAIQMNVGTFGIDQTTQVQVDNKHKAQRVALRPNDIGVYGSYRKALMSGVISAGLTGPLPCWQMRWGQSGVICLVRKLKIQAVVSTTAFNATSVDSAFHLYQTTGHTALDGTNGTYGLYTAAGTGKKASWMAETQFASDTTALRPAQGGMVILNTSASGLTGGTKTQLTDPIATTLNRIVASGAVQTVVTPDPWAYMIDPAEDDVPFELSANQGLNLVIAAIAATGTWRLAVEIDWDEVDPSKYYV